MYKKIVTLIFCGIFLCMIFLPLVKVNLKQDDISQDENRVLAPQAQLFDGDGNWNKHVLSDFEAWFNDHIGFRSHFILANARIQFYGFHVLANNSNMLLGPNGELNYATADIIVDYQHLNLWSEDQLKQITGAYQAIQDYLDSKEIQFYYFQCFDKHSIYPEQFPQNIIQHGDISRTEQRLARMQSDTSVCVISPKEKLLSLKDQYHSYSVWGDPTHWTQRGAYIGYQTLMEQLNQHNGDAFRVLTEDDYQITWADIGSTVFGGIHKVDMEEVFNILEPHGVLTNEKLTLFGEDSRNRCYTNPDASNKTRVLIIGDSYFYNFILDDLAESFYETVMIQGDYTAHLAELVEEYQPDIVIMECAERVDRSHLVIQAGDAVKALSE